MFKEERKSLRFDWSFYSAGQSAGQAIYEHLLQNTHDFDGFIAELQETLRTLSIGILRLRSLICLNIVSCSPWRKILTARACP